MRASLHLSTISGFVYNILLIHLHPVTLFCSIHFEKVSDAFTSTYCYSLASNCISSGPYIQIVAVGSYSWLSSLKIKLDTHLASSEHPSIQILLPLRLRHDPKCSLLLSAIVTKSDSQVSGLPDNRFYWLIGRVHPLVRVSIVLE